MPQKLPRGEPRGPHCQLCGQWFGTDAVWDHQDTCSGSAEWQNLYNSKSTTTRHRHGYCDHCGDFYPGGTHRHRKVDSCATLDDSELSAKNKRNRAQSGIEGKEYLLNYAVGAGSCQFCKKEMVFLRQHINICHDNPNRRPTAVCEHCNDSFEDIQSHVRRCNLNPERSELEVCEYCTARTRDLSWHMLRCSLNPDLCEPVPCEHCNRNYKDIHEHIPRCKNNPDRYAPKQCQHCGEAFLALDAHLPRCRLNPNRRPDKQCDFCSRSFTELWQHLKYCRRNPNNCEPGTCRHCDQIIPERLGTHETGCPANPVNEIEQCIYCSRNIPKVRMASHLKWSCTKTPHRPAFVCRFCGETTTKVFSSHQKHELMCFENPSIPVGFQRCICSQTFASFPSLWRHRHQSTHEMTEHCPLAVIDWDERVPPSKELMMTCVCGNRSDDYAGCVAHSGDCHLYRFLYRCRFRPSGKRNVADWTITANIYSPDERHRANRSLQPYLDPPYPDSEWQRYLSNAEQAIYWDIEAVADFLAHVCIANASGVLINVVIDHGEFKDLWAKRDSYLGRHGQIYMSLVGRYYGPLKSATTSHLQRVSLAELADRMDALGLSKAVALKWSFSYFDWRGLHKALSTIGRQASLPPISRVVRPLVAIRRMYELHGVVSMGLQNLHAILFPDSALLRKHHEADVDVQKLLEVVKHFQDRQMCDEMNDSAIAMGSDQDMLDEDLEDEEELRFAEQAAEIEVQVGMLMELVGV